MCRKKTLLTPIAEVPSARRAMPFATAAPILALLCAKEIPKRWSTIHWLKVYGHGHGHGHGLFIKTRVTEKFTPFPRRVPAVTPTCSELPYMKCCLSQAPHSTYWSQAESQIWFPGLPILLCHAHTYTHTYTRRLRLTELPILLCHTRNLDGHHTSTIISRISGHSHGHGLWFCSENYYD
jgi:hypothetical protein